MTSLDRRTSAWLATILVAYTAAFALQWPRVFLIVDESQYIAQAMAFAQGRLALAGAEIVWPPRLVRAMSDYPPGTSLLQAPFVFIGGWRWAMLASVASMVIATIATARWIRAAGNPALFAALVPGFAGTLLFARTAMSDVPAMAVVAVALVLLWRCDESAVGRSLLAGFVCGAILLFREPAVLIVAPFAIGAIARRKTVAWALVVGGVAAVLLRFGLSEIMFGDPLYVRDVGDAGYGFSGRIALQNLGLYGTVLMVLVPGGLTMPAFYRGDRRVELTVSVAAFLLLFVLYDYDYVRTNGPIKGVVLASRFMLPVIPVLVFAAAEVVPRLVARAPAGITRLAHRLVSVALAGVVVAAIAVHPVARREEAIPLAIISMIDESVPEGRVVLTNHDATLKYLSPVYRPRPLVLLAHTDVARVAAIAAETGGMSVVLLDRTDSEMFRANAARTTAYMAELAARCSILPVREAQPATWALLRIFEVSSCR